MSRRVWHVGCAPDAVAAVAGQAETASAGRRRDVLDRPAEQLESGRVELVAPRPDALRPREPAIEPRSAESASRDMRMRSAISSTRSSVLGLAEQRRDDLDARRPGELERLEHVLRAAVVGADETDARAGRQTGDLVDELEVAGSDEHRDDRHAAGGEHLALVGVEGRRRDEVVVEALESLGHVVDQRALGLDHAREGVDQPLGVVAGVGVRALREEHADERSRGACAPWRRRTSRQRPRRR